MSSSAWQCTQLENLNLRSNQLTGAIPWATMTAVSTIERILLSSNSLDTHDFTTISGIGNLRNLRELDIDTVTGNIPGVTFLSPLNLTLLTLSFAKADLNGTLTGNWPSFPLFGPNLESIDMSGNPLLGTESISMQLRSANRVQIRQ